MDYVPDTSVIVDGRFSKFIEKIESGSRVLICEAMIAEVEHQANQGRNTGFVALDELEKIRKISSNREIPLEFVGTRPNQWQRENGKNGEIDNLIRDIAFDYSATLITGDVVQERVARFKNINVKYLPPASEKNKNFEDFFQENTLSVHIKEDNYVKLKNGVPGKVQTVKTDQMITTEHIKSIIANIMKNSKNQQNSFIEIDWQGVTVIQQGKYRIVITSPPFSSTYEITAVRPLSRKDLDYYDVPESISSRIFTGSSGILVAGSPGAGKSTFVQALADNLNDNGKIVKTMERPRDLQVSKEITQYTVLENSMEKTGDILLLVRNDYTIFDEMRVTSDFKVFADLRLAGVGMIGVVHATKPIDAIHRFIGRIELGLIPQVIDTVLFIKDGRIAQYLAITHTVKVPFGMTQDDLARPVIQIRDAITSVQLYEIYTFGEQIVVVPLEDVESESSSKKLDMGDLKQRLSAYVGTEEISVEPKGRGRIRVTVPQGVRPKLIGRNGSRIDEIEKKLGVRIDVASIESTQKQQVGIEIKNRMIYLHCDVPNRIVNIYADDMMIIQGRTSSKGIIRIKTDSETGINIQRSLKSEREITFTIGEESS